MIYGRLAQLGERLPYKQNVSSSILLSPTIMKRLHVLRAVRSFSFFTFLLIIIQPPARLTTFCASLHSVEFFVAFPPQSTPRAHPHLFLIKSPLQSTARFDIIMHVLTYRFLNSSAGRARDC